LFSPAAHDANGHVGQLRDPIQQFRTLHPDITLMDLQMPEMNGIDSLIAIRNEFLDAKVIVLTTYAGDTQILRALKVVPRPTCSRMLCIRI
jgi:DNA-binding NarL/FixJ family response regulator